MKKFTLKDIEPVIQDEYQIIEGLSNAYFVNAKPIDDADKKSIVWCSPKANNKLELIKNSEADFIICDNEIDIPDQLTKLKNFILVENPRLIYSRIIKALFVTEKPYGIHETAVIHKDAKIHNDVYIGPNTYIGNCTIGKGTIIDGNTYIYDHVEIGANVYIEAGVVLGAGGFGQTQNKSGEWEHFPHIGGLVISDNVFIGANTSVDRGALGNTFIGKGTKISKSVRVAHNVKIGENCIVTGEVLISGSVTIKDNVWIGPNSSLLNKITIGNDVLISIGSTVTKSVNDNYQVIGTRAIPKS